MSALFLNTQELELLNCFNSFDVHYLVIGGHAVQFHGHLRPAKDLDIFIDRSDGNPVRVVSALRSLEEAYARRVMANEKGIAVPVVS